MCSKQGSLGFELIIKTEVDGFRVCSPDFFTTSFFLLMHMLSRKAGKINYCSSCLVTWWNWESSASSFFCLKSLSFFKGTCKCPLFDFLLSLLLELVLWHVFRARNMVFKPLLNPNLLYSTKTVHIAFLLLSFPAWFCLRIFTTLNWSVMFSLFVLNLWIKKASVLTANLVLVYNSYASKWFYGRMGIE